MPPFPKTTILTKLNLSYLLFLALQNLYHAETGFEMDLQSLPSCKWNVLLALEASETLNLLFFGTYIFILFFVTIFMYLRMFFYFLWLINEQRFGHAEDSDGLVLGRGNGKWGAEEDEANWRVARHQCWV